MQYLIVAAHPDDEVLGAGASISRFTREGHHVAVAFMSSQASARDNLSETLRTDEQTALDILGVEKAYHADFPNIRMNTVAHLELVQFVEQCILDCHPDVIITHYPADTNNDHVQTSYAVQAAFRIFQRRTDVPALRELLYMEVPSSTEWVLDSAADRFVPNCFLEIGKEGLERKIEALSAYRDVMRPYPHPRSREALEGLAAYRGSQSGCCYAESFVCAFRRG